LRILIRFRSLSERILNFLDGRLADQSDPDGLLKILLQLRLVGLDLSDASGAPF